MRRSTYADIEADSFLINGEPFYQSRASRGCAVEGLLMNSRMVQGIFDDLNPATRGMWDYPDGPWDADRNTREFVAAMPEWRARGLLSFTINLQGGNPRAYSPDQPWHNSAFREDGSLRSAYMQRLQLVLDRADELGMLPMLGYFYFGQDQHLENEDAVLHACDNATDWVLDQGYGNVLIEIANEVDHPKYSHAVIGAQRCHELIRRVQERSRGRVTSPKGRLPVSASLCGGRIPGPNLVAASDFLLLHGNGISEATGYPNREVLRGWSKRLDLSRDTGASRLSSTRTTTTILTLRTTICLRPYETGQDGDTSITAAEGNRLRTVTRACRFTGGSAQAVSGPSSTGCRN
jgi:hypothetical protein